jgi:hypothetical protein
MSKSGFGKGGNAFHPLKFNENEGAKDAADLEGAEQRKKLAMRLAMAARERAPWCENCNIRKVQYVGDPKDEIYDEMCGPCSRETLIRPKAVRRHAGLTIKETKEKKDE